MPARAKYTLWVPKHDTVGNKLTNLAQAAHHQLVHGPVKQLAAYIDPNKLGHWRHGDPEPHDLLVSHAEETPEMDSHFKSVAHDVGQAANHPAIYATKEGKNGMAEWIVNNPGFVHGSPAHPSALAVPSSALAPAADVHAPSGQTYQAHTGR